MTPRRKRKRLWSFSAGERGHTVTVCERERDGVLYQRITHPTKGQVYRSLKHRDRDRAMQFARDMAEKLRVGVASATSGALTLEQMFARYLADTYPVDGDPKKGAEHAKLDDERRIALFVTQLGATTLATHVTIGDWDKIKAKRASGAIDARGRIVRTKDRVPVSLTTIAHDGAFIRAVYYWAMRTRGPENVPLMSYNPFGAPAPGVKSAFALPKNPSPKRPRVSDDRYERVRAVASRVLMIATKTTPGAVQVPTQARAYRGSAVKKPMLRWMVPSYLLEILDLVWETGRRRDAVRRLWASDVVRENGIIVMLRWRPTKHAEQAEEIIVSAAARAALERQLARVGVIGDRPIFPSPLDASRPTHEKTLDQWLLKAEQLADVGKQDGGLWHPYRRSFATKRKHFADADVAKVGGWRDVKVMKTSYQSADDSTMRLVVEQPARLEERKGGSA